MNKTSFKKTKSFNFDLEDSHHTAKKKKSIFHTKRTRNLDNILKTKDVNKILSLEEKF
jgi:hypothetical protein